MRYNTQRRMFTTYDTVYKRETQLEIKAHNYFKACKRVRAMLRDYPSIKQTLSLEERKKLVLDLARHLQQKEDEEELESHIQTRDELCRHCYNSMYIGKQVVCRATDTTVSKFKKGNCKYYREGYNT